MIDEELTEQVIGAAIEVHRHLGPGLLESAYEQCFCYELKLAGLDFKRQLRMPVTYKDVKLDCGYRIDILVEERVLVELKCVSAILPIHKAQLLTYLRFSEPQVGLLINFNVPALRKGIVRRVLSNKTPSEIAADSGVTAERGLEESAE